ncbi:MAG: Asp23/Gls24 family envelope stress response protein [Bacillota bacterium]
MDSNEQDKLEADLGKLLVAEDTVAFIAMMEASEVEGVHEVSVGVTDELYEIIRNKHARGIRVEVGNKETIINIPISVYFGYDIKKVAQNIQSRVAQAVQDATELKVKEININVNGIKAIDDGMPGTSAEPALPAHASSSESATTPATAPPGSIHITEYVVAWIARTQALEVNGVAGLSSGIAGEIAGLFSRRNAARGVKVEAGQKEVLIDLFLVLQFGCRLPDIAWETQEKVKNSVEKLTGFSVKAVNVTVQGIDFEKEFEASKKK